MEESARRFGLNEGYLAELFDEYLKKPTAVGRDLQAYFEGRQDAAAAPALSYQQMDRALRARELAQAIREDGHLAAHLDPLGLSQPDPELLRPESHGLASSELSVLTAEIIGGPVATGSRDAAEALERLRATYCGTTGYEFAHVTDRERRAWLYENVESKAFQANLERNAKRYLLQRLTQVAAFEQFLHRTFPGQRWFSIEGIDTLVPLLDEILWHACHSDLETAVLGMAHRGRLNVLAHLLGKPYEDILAEFLGGTYAEDNSAEDRGRGWMRDVKYHEGGSAMYPDAGGGEVELRLLPNPSHVELVNPVVEGAVRGLQDTRTKDGEAPRDTALAVLIHGDAAFTGEGIVGETLNLVRLPGYTTGGTIHVIANNQVGFTTDPREAASTRYASGPARGYDVPVVHVNADDVEAVISAVRLAIAYRQHFHDDFLIDLVGYRRYGHNEADEPSFTQPSMYATIAGHPKVRDLWAQQLKDEDVVTEDEAEQLEHEVFETLQHALETVKGRQESETAPGEAPAVHEESEFRFPRTPVPMQALAEYNQALHHLPEGFTLHPKLEQPWRRRRETLTEDGRVDWSLAEALALASLTAESVAVRLTGQDTERGTFSQRHAVLHDAKTGGRLVPLAQFSGARARFHVFNSPLSEAGALGFEYGYTLGAPDVLVLWEAQFGDFLNNAQAVVDEFIASAQAKWGQHSGLVLLLPHAYEGQGPNHSSGHLERSLQLAAEGNLSVVYPTTAAQYFHLLRGQASLLAQGPAPLIVMTPKSLLRHPLAASPAQALAEGGFQPVLDDPEPPANVRRLVLCTGKVFVDLAAHRREREESEVAIVRVEQLFPWPENKLRKLCEKYQGAEICWVQEEPRNRGAWTHVAPRLKRLLGQGIGYIGRPERASPAEGWSSMHKAEQARIVDEVFSLSKTGPGSRR